MKLDTLLLLLSVPLLLRCSYLGKGEEVPRSVASSPPPVTQVDGFVTQEEILQNVVNATGSLLPNESVQIGPEQAGKLVAIYFKESSYVKEGALLAKIDDRELKAQLEKLRVQERMAVKEEERALALRKIEAIPQDELDRLTNTREQIQAEINVIEIQLDKTQIRAPFSGLVGLRQVSLGAYITPSESIAELKQIHPLKLEFDVPEKYMTDIHSGQKVTFSIVGFTEPFTATIYATSTDVTPSTRSFKVRAQCPNPGGALKPGNFAKVDVITGINEHAIMVPSDAVIPVIDGQKVFLAKAGLVEEKMVETGTREGTMIEIRSGLTANDTVIVSGLLALSQGMPVGVENIVEYANYLN